MNIRKATQDDINKIMPIYDRARVFMAESGNPYQWGDSYPQREVIAADIANGNFYVCTEQGEICGAFALIFGADPTYAVIEEGAWLNDAPYATIHRLASAGTHKGIAEACFAWCRRQCANLRIDTHADNKVMQHVIEKAGFVKCGIIYVRDGSARIAYQMQV